MNKYQKILNLFAINSNAEYRDASNGRANYRIKFEGNDTIIFYEGDHTKPDSKKVVNFKEGTYAMYENVNWNEQTKPVKWEIRKEFLILDFQHIADGLNECPKDLEHNPYINKSTKDAKETAYVQYLFKKPNQSLINGIRRVWVDPKKDIKKQVIEAGKNINGYPKYWITDKQVKANVAAFNKAKTFNFKTKFNLYVTKNEPFFNFLAPKEFFVPFKQILKELGFNYTWKEVKGENIFKFDQETSSIFYMVQILNNWYRRGRLNSKQIEFFKKLPPIAKEYPFLTTPDDDVIDEIEKNEKEQSKKYTCKIADRKILDMLGIMLNEGYRYTDFELRFSGQRFMMIYSTESYDKKTKKWESFGGFTMTPIVAQHYHVLGMPILADAVALSNYEYTENFIKMMIDYLPNLNNCDKDEMEIAKDYLEAMLTKENSVTSYFKVNLPKYKGKIYYVNRMPDWIFNRCIKSIPRNKIVVLHPKDVDQSKVIPLSSDNIPKVFPPKE